MKLHLCACFSQSFDAPAFLRSDFIATENITKNVLCYLFKKIFLFLQSYAMAKPAEREQLTDSVFAE